jgi:hypothetical protein
VILDKEGTARRSGVGRADEGSYMLFSDWLAVAWLCFTLTVYPSRTSSYERYDV